MHSGSRGITSVTWYLEENWIGSGDRSVVQCFASEIFSNRICEEISWFCTGRFTGEFAVFGRIFLSLLLLWMLGFGQVRITGTLVIDFLTEPFKLLTQKSCLNCSTSYSLRTLFWVILRYLASPEYWVNLLPSGEMMLISTPDPVFRALSILCHPFPKSWRGSEKLVLLMASSISMIYVFDIIFLLLSMLSFLLNKWDW